LSFCPHRIIIAEEKQKAGGMVKEPYEGISARRVRIDITAAEMIKFVPNAFLTTKIFSLREFF
jgi:UDP-glucose 6-dehydrogenase